MSVLIYLRYDVSRSLSDKQAIYSNYIDLKLMQGYSFHSPYATELCEWHVILLDDKCLVITE